MAQNLNDVYRVNILTKIPTQLGLVTLHYFVSEKEGAGVTDQTVAKLMDANFGPLIKPCMNDQAAYGGCSVQKIWPTPVSIAVYDSTNAGPGGQAGGMLPHQTCGLISKRTAFAGRKYRGRAYVPWPSVAEQTAAGVPTNAYQTKLLALADAMLAVVNSGNQADRAAFFPCLYNRVAHTIAPLRSCIVDLKWATQRRRGQYGKVNVVFES